VGIGGLLAGLLAALAPVIARFYGEPDLTGLTCVLALGLIFGGLTIQHQALLKRQMRFGALATIEVISMITGAGVAVAAALLGAGYWALVLMQLATSATLAIGVWAALEWRPGLPNLRSGIRSMLSFGRDVVGFRLASYFARNSDKILIGRVCGKAVLGSYGRAYSLVTMPLSQIIWPITSVAMPALSRLQNEPRRYTAYYTRLVQLLSFLIMPLVAFLVVSSQSVVNLVLGHRWAQVGPILEVLAIAAFVQPVLSTTGIVLLSLGRSSRLLKFGVAHSSLIVCAFLIGVHWGAIGVARGYAIVNYAVLLPALWYCFRGTPVKMGTAVRAAWRPGVASFAMAVAATAVKRWYLVGTPDIAVVGGCLAAGLCAYLVTWALVPGGTTVLKDFAGYVALIFSRKQREN